MLAALLAASVGLVGFHRLQRGPETRWKFYDPTFLYALSGTRHDLMRAGCGESPVFAFGSSVLLAAFGPLPPRPPGRWTVTPAEIGGSGREVRILTRYGSTDLRLFAPLLRELPRCPKTIVLHSDVFVPRGFKRPDWSDFYYTVVYRLSTRIERLWPGPLRRKTRQESIRPVGECNDACLEKRRDAMARRYGEFRGLSSEHLQLARDLVARGARVVILDVGRSQWLEAEFQEGLTRFRDAVQAFSERSPGIEYLAFAPQQDELYADHTHLNEDGRRVFERWVDAAPVFRDTGP